MIIKPAKIIAF